MSQTPSPHASSASGLDTMAELCAAISNGTVEVVNDLDPQAQSAFPPVVEAAVMASLAGVSSHAAVAAMPSQATENVAGDAARGPPKTVDSAPTVTPEMARRSTRRRRPTVRAQAAAAGTPKPTAETQSASLSVRTTVSAGSQTMPSPKRVAVATQASPPAKRARDVAVQTQTQVQGPAPTECGANPVPELLMELVPPYLGKYPNMKLHRPKSLSARLEKACLVHKLLSGNPDYVKSRRGGNRLVSVACPTTPKMLSEAMALPLPLLVVMPTSLKNELKFSDIPSGATCMVHSSETVEGAEALFVGWENA